LIGGRNEQATTLYRARNAFASPLRYEVHPQDQIRIMLAIEENEEELTAIYHSHTGSPARPSQTDINLAENWPDPLYLICSIAERNRPEVRAFEIRDGVPKEVTLDVE
jgi:proteasome lid subunit RPN8/RPN11